MEMYNIAMHIPYRDSTYKHCIEFFIITYWKLLLQNGVNYFVICMLDIDICGVLNAIIEV